MSKDQDDNSQMDTETILMTLDQIDQTIDIMTSVVGRLRGYLNEQTIEPELTEGVDTPAIPTPPISTSIH
jgi:hypothetical protein